MHIPIPLFPSELPDYLRGGAGQDQALDSRPAVPEVIRDLVTSATCVEAIIHYDLFGHFHSFTYLYGGRWAAFSVER